MIGYHSYLPTRSAEYPDSVAEAAIVKQMMKKPDSYYFELTDKSPITAFTEYLNAKGIAFDPEELRQVALRYNPILLDLKDYYNRPRPSQVSDIIPQKSSTADTPSYPAGHSFQAYILADYLGRKHLLHYFAFRRIANRIANARVRAGLHYPSDNRAARQLADHFLR